jgi:hypothetical protein
MPTERTADESPIFICPYCRGPNGEHAADCDRDAPPEKDAGEIALDEIAALCGVPEWEYPGQVVRDVRAVVAERDLWKDRAQRAQAAAELLYKNSGTR